MAISEFGKGLGIVIYSKSVLEHDWMSFACWYSIKKFLPDAEIILICERGNVVFNWTYKFGVKTIYNTNYKFSNDLFIVEIQPSVMAVRPIVDVLGPIDAKSSQIATFVDYDNGCGNFVKEATPPFGKKFVNIDVSPNEIKIFKLWEDCLKIYSFLSGTP
jgi:hypothetical protein